VVRLGRERPTLGARSDGRRPQPPRAGSRLERRISRTSRAFRTLGRENMDPSDAVAERMRLQRAQLEDPSARAFLHSMASKFLVLYPDLDLSRT
jgi:hypothetical protein